MYGTGASSSGFDFQGVNLSYLDANSTKIDSCFLIKEYSGAPANILTLVKNPDPEYELPGIDNDSIIGLNDIITINTFIRDNYNPLNYIGTIVSQNESVAYEVSLISLCLPNVTLKTGSRIAQYPYVYVQLKPTNSPSFMSNSLTYSNNPNSTDALFVVAITDVVDPITSAYVRVGCNQIQTLKIKPNSNFLFSVYLSDGSLFQPFDNDYISPFPPNAFLQIEALFSFQRLT
jgi:hypothetical protein